MEGRLTLIKNGSSGLRIVFPDGMEFRWKKGISRFSYNGFHVDVEPSNSGFQITVTKLIKRLSLVSDTETSIPLT